MKNTFFASDIPEWHNWLQDNYQRENEIWLIFYKPNAPITGIKYEDALDEALCFGWIDSLIQKIDEQKYARKFTPRTNSKKWSDTNKKKVVRLIQAGRMTQAGLEKFPFNPEEIDKTEGIKKEEFIIPEDIEVKIRQNSPAWKIFEKLPPSQRKNYIRWVLSAKKQETIDKRLAEVISVLEANKPLGLK